MARPVELNEDTIIAAEKYLKERGSVDFRSLLPTIEGLALACGIHKDTVYEWEKPLHREDPDAEPTEQEIALADLRARFSDVVARVRLWQAEKVLQNSIVGRYNASTSALILAKHDYVSKQELAGPEGQPLVQTLVKIVGDTTKQEQDNEVPSIDQPDRQPDPA